MALWLIWRSRRRSGRLLNNREISIASELYTGPRIPKCINKVSQLSRNTFEQTGKKLLTVVPTKSDSDVILCLQLLSNTLNCTLHLS